MHLVVQNMLDTDKILKIPKICQERGELIYTSIAISDFPEEVKNFMRFNY